MNWVAIGAIAELAGAVAVVASLVYVGRQMQHNTKAMRSAAHESVVDAARDISTLLASNAELALLFKRGVDDPGQLTEGEQVQFFYFVYNLLKSYEGMHYHHARGNLDDNLFAGYRQTMAIYMHVPGVQLYWKDRKALFSPDFVAFVDTLEPAPALRPLGPAVGDS